MNKWYLQTFKILDEDLLYYLSDLEVHLKSAEGSELLLKRIMLKYSTHAVLSVHILPYLN